MKYRTRDVTGDGLSPVGVSRKALMCATHTPCVHEGNTMTNRIALLHEFRIIADNAWHTGAFDVYEAATTFAALLSA